MPARNHDREDALHQLLVRHVVAVDDLAREYKGCRASRRAEYMDKSRALYAATVDAIFLVMRPTRKEKVSS